MSKLVFLRDNEPQTTTIIIAKELKRLHKNIISIVENYRENFEKFGNLGDFKNVQRHGKATKYYYLNEPQLTFLIMMLRVKKNENDMVLSFKEKITQEFFLMRKWIISQKTQKLNQNYIETRNQSKLGRKQQTDIIKTFIDYAKLQGSQSADKYYMIFSKMENSAFFILKEKFKNVREILSIDQLSKIIVADMIVRTVIIEGMDKEMFYKDIFQLAKKRVVEMAKSLGFKEVLPGVQFKQISMLNSEVK